MKLLRRVFLKHSATGLAALPFLTSTRSLRRPWETPGLWMWTAFVPDILKAAAESPWC